MTYIYPVMMNDLHIPGNDEWLTLYIYLVMMNDLHIPGNDEWLTYTGI